MTLISVKKGFAVYALFTLINLFASYGTLLFLTNVLPKSDYALYGLLTTVMSICTIVVNFGHKDAAFKFASQRDFQQLNEVLNAFFLWLIGFAFFYAISSILSPIFAIAGIAFCCYLLLQVTASINRGKGKYLADAAAIPLYRLFWLLGISCSYFLMGSLDTIVIFTFSAVSACIALCVTGLGNLFSVKRFSDVPSSLPFSNKTLRSFFLLEVATVTYMKIDMILLKTFNLGNENIAEYFFSLQVFEAVMLILAPLSYMFFNHLNAMIIAKSERSFFAEIAKFVVIMVLITLIIQLGWWLLGEWLLTMMFPAYINSAGIISLMLLSVLPMGLSMMFSHALFAINKESIYVKICVMGLVVCLFSNLGLIHYYQVYGAAVARLVTEMVILCLLIGTLPFVKRRFSPHLFKESS